MRNEYRLNPDWSEEDVRRWLLTWFTGGVSDLPGLPTQVAHPVAVQAVFDAENPERRELLKRGTVMALQDWRARAHGFEALRQLAHVVALVRASSAVGVLGYILERQFDQERSEAQSKALSAVVATLHGFAPTVDVERALRRAFYHQRCDPHLAAQLFVGLASCKPEDYALHASRFLSLRERVASRFMHIGPALLQAISPPTFIERFRDLSVDEQQAFVEILSRIKNSPLKITVSKQGLRLVWAAQPKRQTFATPHPTAPTMSFAHQYELMMMEAMTFGDVNAFLRRSAGGPSH